MQGMLPGNRAHGATFRQTCLAIVRERYEDFGPTLAAEKLAEVHGLPVGVETLRQWMVQDGIWVRRRDRGSREWGVVFFVIARRTRRVNRSRTSGAAGRCRTAR